MSAGTTSRCRASCIRLRNGVSIILPNGGPEGSQAAHADQNTVGCESKSTLTHVLLARGHRARYEADVNAVHRKEAQELAPDQPVSLRTEAAILTRSVLCLIFAKLEVNRGF